MVNALTPDESAFQGVKLVAPAKRGVSRGWAVAYKTAADLVSKGSMAAITVVAARQLSQQSFGVFSLASTIGWLLAVVTDFGIQMHLARAVARDPGERAGLLMRWLRVRLWTAAIGVTIVAIAVSAWPAARSIAAPIVIFAIVYACSGLIEFLHYFYRGLSRSEMESALTVWQRGATLVCAVGALLWRPNLVLLGVAMLIPVAITLAVSLTLARGIAGDVGDRSQARPGEFRSDVLPIGAGIVLSALYFRIDVLLVQYWSGTTSVALYNAVFRIVEALRLFPAAVLAVTLPLLVRAADEWPLLKVAAAVTLPSIAAAIALAAAAGWIVPLLFGGAYAPAVPAFRILLLSFPLMSLNYALTHQLIGWNGQRTFAALCAAALVLNVALNARLIPALSIDGAAWSTVATELLLTAGCLGALRFRTQ